MFTMPLTKECKTSLTEEDKKYIEQYRKEHPVSGGDWINHALNEKIELDDLLALVEDTPVISYQIICLSSHDIMDYKTAKEPLKQFQSLLEEAVIIGELECIQKDDRKFFDKGEVIRWVEKSAANNSEFHYELKKEFVEDYKRRHQNSTTEDKSTKNIIRVQDKKKLTKEDFFKLLAADILGDIEAIKLNEMRNMPFIIRGCLSFCGFELNKNRKVYDINGREVVGVSYDVLRIYLKDMNLPSGRQGNFSNAYKDSVEKWLRWLKKDCFDLEKYSVHKIRLKKLIVRGVFS